MPAPVTLPAPVSPALAQKIAEAVAKVPVGKTVAVDILVTKTGTEASVGYRIRPNWSVGAWVGREWSGAWDAGARMTFIR